MKTRGKGGLSERDSIKRNVVGEGHWSRAGGKRGVFLSERESAERIEIEGRYIGRTQWACQA